MIKIFTEQEYAEIEQESTQQLEFLENSKSCDQIKTWDSKLSNGYYRLNQLRPGLYLEVFDETYYQEVNCQINHYGYYELISKFYLSGNHGVISPGIAGVNDHYQEIAGNNYLFYLPDIEEIEQNFPGHRIYLIRIALDLDFLKSFINGIDSLPKQLHPFLESDSVPLFHRPLGKITLAMHTALQQIINVPYQGIIQRMYLEGKVLELLALQFAQLMDTESAKKPLINLKSADIEKIYQARDIVIRNYEHPPSLLDLAQQIGINDNKLKYGFREVFGTTVFGYLRDYRLEVARKLLQEQKQNVRTVVNTIGYANQSHFAAAFKRKFGITPQDCRLGRKVV
ncbi:helix-turn-helix transcriptional regulator [Umezakia ovalisporum]|jgi:AraC-like DNA-binding protein|uniref:helix-turn-helix transcriptional regulator n=1 Tax=Umezakia ovalisporum TaxID=75695 RepID=UPI002474197D|nr:AraC family transcriptional regulator [Umezakia ovalisporum]MBI1242177.1 helix-turn-helix domain-containing protein [Nostoc sp. RI_552]MDH6065884.1 AraC family transcriptional regulator [Umezakia ovalisporum APH033B]MDH6076892.1 AraC family transcriptional regulator [Umezakia ovalisporum FSS-45]